MVCASSAWYGSSVWYAWSGVRVWGVWGVCIVCCFMSLDIHASGHMDIRYIFTAKRTHKNFLRIPKKFLGNRVISLCENTRNTYPEYNIHIQYTHVHASSTLQHTL